MTAISDLDIFARVARTGNMSAAGREIGLSPAVVSKRISQLEERLGTRLFQRTTRHLTLTETGAGYFKRVADILSLCEEAEDFVSRRNTKPRGLLKISVPTSFSRKHIAPHLGGFQARFPEIELHVNVTDAFVDIIREGFDLAVRVGELGEISLAAQSIAADTRVLCAAPSYIEAHGTPPQLVDLELHNCLTADPVDVWRLCGPEGDVQLRPQGSVYCNSVEFLRELVLSGVGIGLLSTWDAGEALREGKLRIVLPQYRSTAGGIHVVYPSREFMPAKVDALIDYLSELFGPPPYWERDLNLDKAISSRSAIRSATRPGGRADVSSSTPKESKSASARATVGK